MKSILIIVLIIVAIVTSYLGHFQWTADNTKSLSLSTTVERRPDFSLLDLNGQLRTNTEWDGKVVILNFWATWCFPCLSEIPELIDLQTHYAAQGLQLVGIALDDLTAVQELAESMKINYPILVDAQKAMTLSKLLGNRLGVLPFTVVINRQGNIVLRYPGEIDPHKFRQVILPLLDFR